jgi:hypothetical protein
MGVFVWKTGGLCLPETSTFQNLFVKSLTITEIYGKIVFAKQNLISKLMDILFFREALSFFCTQ